MHIGTEFPSMHTYFLVFNGKWQPVGESNPSYLVENQVS